MLANIVTGTVIDKTVKGNYNTVSIIQPGSSYPTRVNVPEAEYKRAEMHKEITFENVVVIPKVNNGRAWLSAFIAN